MKLIAKFKAINVYAFLLYSFIVLAFLSVTATYAWFSSELVNLNGDLNLGNLSATVKIYENDDQSTTGLTDATIADSISNNITTFDLVQRPWYSNVYTSVYFQVDNTGSIDLKSIFKLNHDENNLETFLSYYYYQLADITQEVNGYSFATASEQLSAYNQNFQSTIDQDVDTYVNNVTTNGKSVTASYSAINMGETSYEGTSFFRLDIAVDDIPSELLTEFNSLAIEQREIMVNASVTLKQTNAPNDEGEDSGLSVYVSTSDSFINAINTSLDGDTLYLTSNIGIPRNITITKRLNIVLNGYSLTIDGNLAYDVASAGIISLDVSNSSTLNILNSLIIDTPNSTFKILGSGAAAQSITLGDGVNENTGQFYVNALKDETDSQTYGYYQYGLSIMKKINETTSTLAPMTIDSHTRVSVGTGSEVGALILKDQASNIDIYNKGQIASIDFSNMSLLDNTAIQIYIHNSNTFATSGDVIILPSWSIGWNSKETFEIANAINTRIVNAPGSNTNYSVTGSSLFTNEDIESADIATDSVVELSANSYRVNVNLDGSGHDSLTLRYYLQEYYNNLNNNATEAEFETWLTTIESLAVYTYNTTVVKALDFQFLNNYLTNVSSLDFSYANIEGKIIPANAFYNKTSLENVYFPSNDLQIGDLAFFGTSLKNITLSGSITSIGIDAFDIDTSLNGMLEVFYEGENITNLTNNITGLVAEKTLLFMSSTNVQAFKDVYNITDTWYINSYVNYDFYDQYQNYYRIIDGTSVEIVYYDGNWADLNISNEVLHDTNSYRITGISYSAFRRSINQAGTTVVNVNLPENITSIKDDAFYNAYIDNLHLNNVESIGKSAFENATITTSHARPVSFTNMTKVESRAFAGSTIGVIGTTSLLTFEIYNVTDGVINNSLNLNGAYSIGDQVFDSASFYGVKLNLSGVNTLTSSMTNNLSLYGSELNLNNVTEIANSAFDSRFKSYTELQPYNKVFANEVKTIGELAFRGMYVNEFSIGVKSLYATQSEVNNAVSYGGTSNGMIYSDFKATNLTIDGMLPQIASGKSTFLFGTNTASREYENVVIKNTFGLLYEFMFYGSSSVNFVNITNLNLHDINTVGDYAFYNTNVANVNTYSGGVLTTNAAINSVGDYAFRFSSIDLLGDLSLTNIGIYAFADTTVPATSFTITESVGEYAFYNSNTTNVLNISISGSIGDYAFNQANIHSVDTFYINGLIGLGVFENSRVYDASLIQFEDTTISQNTFNNAIIYSNCLIETIGISNVETLAFNNLVGAGTTINLTNSLTIAEEALKGVDVLTLRLGNSNFYNSMQNNYIYGTVNGGIFTQNVTSSIQNLHIDGELPDQRLGTYVLGAQGANINISNIYLSSACTNIPENTFYSQATSATLIVDNFYIQSENLTINAQAFNAVKIENIIYDASNYGQITFAGESAFNLATIGNFTNFTYLDATTSTNKGVLQNIENNTFKQATFKQNSNLELFNYVTSIGNYAFSNASFALTSAGDAASFNFSEVVTIGYNIFENVSSPLGTITLGNTDYYQASTPNFYYGNHEGNEGILATNGSITIENLVLAGNLPDPVVTQEYQTKILGISTTSNLSIQTVTIENAVTKIAHYALSGLNSSNKVNITTLEVFSTTLDIGNSSFAFNNITYFNIYSSSINLNEKSFEYSNLGTLNYDRTSGVGELTFSNNAEYTFQYSTIQNFTGFTDASSGVVKQVGGYAFYNATFAQDCDVSWLNYVEEVNYRAFMQATFTQNSLSEYVQIDLSNAITLAEEIFAYIPVKIGELTLGNSNYNSLYGSSYSYGSGTNGVLYAAGHIDVLNIVGDLPTNNTYNMLGNNYDGSTWAVSYGTVNISQDVTSIPYSTFISNATSVPVQINELNINSTNLNIGIDAFYYANIQTVNFYADNLIVQANAFNSTTINQMNINGLSIELGNSAFKNSIITNIAYTGSTSGDITMSGTSTFENTIINTISGFTYTQNLQYYSIVSNISSNAFKNTIFAQDCDVSWIQYTQTIGEFAFNGATFTQDSSNNYVNLDLTQVLTIGQNAFYQLKENLGIVTVGNSNYLSNPSYAYGNGTQGIFNNAGTIQHLIVAGDLPSTTNSLGNATSNITYATTYNIVEIESNVTSLPTGVFAGIDSAYSTNINSLYIYSPSLEVNAEAFSNTIITNLYIPNTTTLSNIGAYAFNNSNITNTSIPNTLTLAGHVNAYAFHSFDFSGIILNVETVSYIGEYAFSYITYNGSLVFNSALILTDANYMFANANISGNLTFNNLRSMSSNGFNGIISGNSVTYTFTFESTSSVTSDYAFANMNGGGSVYMNINGLPTLNSYRAFYNSTNITTLNFNEDLINLDADNVFEGANNLTSIAFNNEMYVVNVNSTITTMPTQVKIYVPGGILSLYLMHPNWSLVANQISTTYNIDSQGNWGFYIIDGSYEISLVKYLGSSTTVSIPTSIGYNSINYTVISLEADTFTGTAVSDVIISRSIERVDMDVFSNSNIEDVNFTGAGTEPFYIDTDGSGNKLIYESSNRTILYKYLSSNTSSSYTIRDSVIELAQKAFYRNDHLEEINFSAGQADTGGWFYDTNYISNFTLASYAISECPNLTSVHIQNNSSGFGVILNSYAIAANPSLETINIIGFSSIINSYAIYNNPSMISFRAQRATNQSFGGWFGTNIYSNLSIEPYAFFGSGDKDETTSYYTNYNENYLHSHAFSNSSVTLFEFNVPISYSNYIAEVYNSDAFAVGINIDVNGDGDIVQTYEEIIIRVPSNQLNQYRSSPGFSFYYNSIVGVSSFS